MVDRDRRAPRMRPNPAVRLCSVAGVLCAGLAAGCAFAQTWVPVRDVDLEIREGGILDLSTLAGAGPAGRHGWAVRVDGGAIGFERSPTPQRFFAAGFAFSPASGGFPEKEEADRVVEQLRRTGYNAVRLQNVDANLMTKRVDDFDFDPVQLDRFDYFFSRLKAAGLYMVMDVMYLDNGAFGNILPHRWVKKHNLRQSLYLDESARAHWLQLLKAMLNRPNKYTGTVPIKDPALLSLVLVNEGGIVELAYRQEGGFNAGFPAAYAPEFNAWLSRKYGSERTLSDAWQGELGGDESLKAGVAVPKALRGKGARHRDFMQFVVDKERQTYQWMHEQARALGYGGFTTAFNNWGFWQSDISRASLPLVDMHSYHVLPTSFVAPGSRVAQSSALSNAARFVRELAGTRQWGKPFTVSEYGQPFWNSSRRESVALVPSYAALQGWDLVSQFTETPIQLRYEKTTLSRRAAIHPFGIGADPVLRAGERLAALLYRRGDVARSPARVSVMLDPASVMENGEGMSQLTEGLSRLSLLGGYGLQIGDAIVDPGNRTAGKSFSIVTGASSTHWKGLLANLATRIGVSGADNERLEELKSKGLLPRTNRSNFARQVYESDTGQLLLQAKEEQFTISTPSTIAIAVQRAPASAGSLNLSTSSVPATVSLSAMDGQELAQSKRMLLMVLTDAQNSDMAFEDAERNTLLRLGNLPVQLLGVQLSLIWTGPRSERLRAYALALNGERRDPVALTITADGWQLQIDTSKLPGGPTTYFELSEQ